jgi:hypothetical protein
MGTSSSPDSAKGAAFPQPMIRNELPLPTELLHHILGDVLSTYLHDKLLSNTLSQTRWDDVSTLLETCFTFKEIIVEILRDALGILQVENVE